MGLDGNLDVMLQIPVLRVGDVADAQQLLDLLPTLIGHADGLVLFIDHEIAGEDLLFAALDLFPLFERGQDAVHAGILVRGLVRGAADDQRSAGFIDQDRVNLVDDREVVPTLHAIGVVKLHVVAQVVETELVVGAVGDVGAIRGAALGVIQIVHNHADGQPQELVDLAHPLGIAFGQVVIDRHHVHAMACQRIQVAGQGRYQGLAFAGLHFGDLALVQHHAADQLHVKVPHLQYPPASLAHHREGFGQNLVQHHFFFRYALFGVVDAIQPRGDAGAEFQRLGAQLVVRQSLHGRLERPGLFDHGRHPLDHAFVTGSENLG